MAPPRKEKPEVEIPDDISDNSDTCKVTDKLVAGAQQVSESTDATSSSDSSYSSYRRPNIGNVIPAGSPGSPRVRLLDAFTKYTDQSGDWLQKWYSENYEKVENYEYIRFELLHFLRNYMPGIQVDENIKSRNLVESVKELVLDLHTKFNRFNLDLREISGHEVAGYIHDHHRKVLKVVDDYENKLKVANEEIAQYKAHNAHLDAELSAVLQRMYLERGTANSGGFEDSVSEEQFMADLQSRVAHSYSLQSSLKEELQRERQQNEGLQRQLAHLAREKVHTEEKCMQEIVELSKRAEINSMLEHGISSMLKGGAKEPNTQDCQNLIDKWKNEINQVIDQNSKEIAELLKKVESQNKEMAMLQAQANEQDEKLEEIQQTQRFEDIHNHKSDHDSDQITHRDIKHTDIKHTETKNIHSTATEFTQTNKSDIQQDTTSKRKHRREKRKIESRAEPETKKKCEICGDAIDNNAFSTLNCGHLEHKRCLQTEALKFLPCYNCGKYNTSTNRNFNRSRRIRVKPWLLSIFRFCCYCCLEQNSGSNENLI